MKSHFYDITYQFSSSLDEIEGYRYLTTYNANIYEVKYESEERLLIGKFTIELILVGLAMNEGYPLIDVLDMEEYTFRIGQDIFDLETSELKEEILKFYDSAFVNSDICFLTRLEIIESHRGKGIGKKVIKDICNRFSSSCGLFVVHAFPLQFENEVNAVKLDELPEWSEMMNFSILERDFEKAFYQLKSFYQKIGFDHLEGFDHLMFLNPGLKNSKLDKIHLD